MPLADQIASARNTLNKNLLGDIFHVLAPSQDPARTGKYAVLMTPHQFSNASGPLPAPGEPVRVGRRASKLEARPGTSLTAGAGRKAPTFGTRAIGFGYGYYLRLPEPASFVSLCRPEILLALHLSIWNNTS